MKKLQENLLGMSVCIALGFILSWGIFRDSAHEALGYGLAAAGIYLVFALVPTPKKVQAEAKRMKGLSKEDIKKQGIQLRGVYIVSILIFAVVGLAIFVLAT